MRTSHQEQRLDQLVELIYDSVQDLGKIAPAMQAMCAELGTLAGHYVHMNVDTREVFNSFVSDPAYSAGDAEYKAYYSSVDERLQWIATGGVGEWRADHERFDDRFVRRSEIYNDFLFKYGGRHMIVGRISGECHDDEAISFLRPLGAKEFDQQDRQFLSQVSGHWIRSSALRRRLRALEAQHLADQTLLQHLPYGTVWVDSGGVPVSMNPVAMDILRVGDGIRMKGRSLHAGDPNGARLLDAAIRQATGSGARQGQWFALRRRLSPHPLLVSVIPGRVDVAAEMVSGGPLALLILQDMSRQRLPRSVMLTKVFGLTPAEARLAEALLDNETVESYAQKANVSRNTVRTHLASVFSKTGTRRQAELLRTLMMSEPQIPL